MRTQTAFFLMLACCHPALSADGDVRWSSIKCGGTLFTARTQVHDDLVTKQTIVAKLPGNPRSYTVDLRQSLFALHEGHPGLAVVADRVSSWGCATTPKTPVLILWYDCPQTLPEDVPGQFCSATGEWYRYIAPSGRLLDTGFGLGRGIRDSDTREAALRTRLGLPIDRESVRFRSVIYPSLNQIHVR